MKGRLIVLEGVDGSGTTTQGKLLCDALVAQGYRVHLTCEPSSGPMGRFLRDILEKRVLKAGEPWQFDACSLALLFAADRVDHIQNEIKPRLQAGEIVISDRYLLSSLVYQSATADPQSSASDIAWLKEINSAAIAADLTFVFDLPAEVARARRSERGGQEELFERAELQQRLGELYRRAQEFLPEQNIRMIAADDSLEGVLAQLLQAIQPLLA